MAFSGFARLYGHRFFRRCTLQFPVVTASTWARNSQPISEIVSLSSTPCIPRFFSNTSAENPNLKDVKGNRETIGDKEANPKNGEQEEVSEERTRVLQAALIHVPKLGWSEAALIAGARDLDLSPAIIGLFPRKEAALVEFFMEDCLQKLLDIIEREEETELPKLTLQERIVRLVRLRLEMQIPYVSRWAQALSVQANPANAPTSFKQRAVLMDEIWHAVGDSSSDIDWYAKRGVLAAVYTATELYMLTDYSTEFQETWVFLERRVKDAMGCSKTAQEAFQLAQAVGAGLGNSFQALFRR